MSSDLLEGFREFSDQLVQDRYLSGAEGTFEPFAVRSYLLDKLSKCDPVVVGALSMVKRHQVILKSSLLVGQQNLDLTIPEYHRSQDEPLGTGPNTDMPLPQMCSRNELQNDLGLTDLLHGDQQHVVPRYGEATTTDKVGGSQWGPAPGVEEITNFLKEKHEVNGHSIISSVSGDSGVITCFGDDEVDLEFGPWEDSEARPALRVGSYLTDLDVTIDMVTPKVDGVHVEVMGQDGQYYAFRRDRKKSRVTITTHEGAIPDVHFTLEVVEDDDSSSRYFLTWLGKWNVRNVNGFSGMRAFLTAKDVRVGEAPVSIASFTSTYPRDSKVPSDGWIIHSGNSQYWIKHTISIDVDKGSVDQLRRAGVLLDLDVTPLEDGKVHEYERDEENDMKFNYLRARPDKLRPNSIGNLISTLKSPEISDLVDVHETALSLQFTGEEWDA